MQNAVMPGAPLPLPDFKAGERVYANGHPGRVVKLVRDEKGNDLVLVKDVLGRTWRVEPQFVHRPFDTKPLSNAAVNDMARFDSKFDSRTEAVKVAHIVAPVLGLKPNYRKITTAQSRLLFDAARFGGHVEQKNGAIVYRQSVVR